jgi:hypothetical protein
LFHGQFSIRRGNEKPSCIPSPLHGLAIDRRDSAVILDPEDRSGVRRSRIRPSAPARRRPRTVRTAHCLPRARRCRSLCR